MYSILQAADSALSAQSLATIPGIVAVTLIIVQATKAVLPFPIGVGWLRGEAALVAVALAILAAAAGVSDAVSGELETAALILAWVFVIVNGLVAATSAMGTFDLVKGQFSDGG